MSDRVIDRLAAEGAPATLVDQLRQSEQGKRQATVLASAPEKVRNAFYRAWNPGIPGQALRSRGWSVKRYYVEPEDHTGLPGLVRGEWKPGIRFRFAIRRGDGSLVFRAETATYANQLAANLNCEQPAETHA